MDCSPPGSSIHGVFQARILELFPYPPPGDLLNKGLNPYLLSEPLTLAGRFFYYLVTVITKEAEVEPFYEDLQHLLELTPKKYVLFIIGD